MAKNKSGRKGARAGNPIELESFEMSGAQEAAPAPIARRGDHVSDGAADLWDDRGFDEPTPAADRDSGGWDATRPVGPGNPPRRSSFQKGGPSPNPKGRPPKPPEGPITRRLGRKLPGTDMTVLEAINRKINAEELHLKPKAMKLSGERRDREALLEQRRADYARYEQEIARQRAILSDRPASHQHIDQGKVVDRFLKDIEVLMPGLMDALRKLDRMEAVTTDENGDHVVPDDLAPFLRR